jgi:hypothetical protein
MGKYMGLKVSKMDMKLNGHDVSIMLSVTATRLTPPQIAARKAAKLMSANNED